MAEIEEHLQQLERSLGGALYTTISRFEVRFKAVDHAANHPLLPNIHSRLKERHSALVATRIYLFPGPVYVDGCDEESSVFPSGAIQVD